jgi:hypothetical protein
MVKFAVSRHETLIFPAIEEAMQQYTEWSRDSKTYHLILSQIHECGCIEMLKPNQMDPKVLIQIAKDTKEEQRRGGCKEVESQ